MENDYLVESGKVDIDLLLNERASDWDRYIEDDNILEDFKVAIPNFFIPFNISKIKIAFNSDYFKQNLLVETESSHIAPSLISLQKSRKAIPPGYKEWFIIAFPDVVLWAMSEENKNYLKSIFRSELLSGKLVDNNDYIQPEFLLKFVSFYLEETNKILECSIYSNKIESSEYLLPTTLYCGYKKIFYAGMSLTEFLLNAVKLKDNHGVNRYNQSVNYKTSLFLPEEFIEETKNEIGGQYYKNVEIRNNFSSKDKRYLFIPSAPKPSDDELLLNYQTIHFFDYFSAFTYFNFIYKHCLFQIVNTEYDSELGLKSIKYFDGTITTNVSLHINKKYYEAHYDCYISIMNMD